MEDTPPFIPIRTRQPARYGASMSSADSAYGSASESSYPAATHDISRVNYHVKHIDAFARALEDSVARAFPNQDRADQRYSRVYALLLHWESDDLWVLPELEDLEKCFREHYCFKTEIFSIPSENSHLELMLKVGDMVKQYESEETLFIVYYGGHARIDESRHSTWCANRRIDSPSLQWSAIQTLLERSISDVLILLDCCAGAASATYATGQSITETICASSWDAIAPNPGSYSFTNCLIEVLEEWRGRTFSAAMLHAEILARLKHPRPILINGKHFEARATPVHFMLTSNHKAPSIEICKLLPRRQPPPSSACDLTLRHRSAAPRPAPGTQPLANYPLIDGRLPCSLEPNEDEPHVLISLALEDDQRLDLQAWEEWLAKVPTLAKYVKVQGVFKSHSTLLLFSLPVMVWDFLPDDPACSFIAFIRSNNLLHDRKSGDERLKQSVPVSVDTPASSPVCKDQKSSSSPVTSQPVDDSNVATTDAAASANPNKLQAAQPLSSTQPTNPELPVPVSRPDDRSQLPTLKVSDAPTPARSITRVLSLRDVPSTTPTSLLERPQTLTRSLSAAATVSTGATHREDASSTPVIDNHLTYEEPVPFFENAEENLLPAYVTSRLENYYQDDPNPSIAILQDLAANLRVGLLDVQAWFRRRREEDLMMYKVQRLQIASQRIEPSDGPKMILPGQLNALLEIYPTKGILLVDLRSPSEFERSHIHDAINLRAPVSFVESTSLEMIEDTFMDDQSRRSFSKWRHYKCLVFYDRAIEFDWECPVAAALYSKLQSKGWFGQCFILKGHFREFSSSFDKHISGTKMTSAGKEYLDSLRQLSSPTYEEEDRRDSLYEQWLDDFTQQRVPTVELVPAKKQERLNTVEQHQKELEAEFESRFPALYRKAQAMRSIWSSTTYEQRQQLDNDDEEPASPLPSPPPGYLEPFRPVRWTPPPPPPPPPPPREHTRNDNFDRKAPLVESLVRGLERIRTADVRSSPAEPGTATPQQQAHQESVSYASSKPGIVTSSGGSGDYSYEHDDYDKINPKSEGLTADQPTYGIGLGVTTSGGPEAVTAQEGMGKETSKIPQLLGRLKSSVE